MVKILIISDTHDSWKYLQRAFQIAASERVDAMFHLGDIGPALIPELESFFVVPGNHDRRSQISRLNIVDDCILSIGGISVVTKSLGRLPIAMRGYKKKLIQSLSLAQSLGKPVVLLSHCGGKIACHKRFLRVIEQGHAEVIRQIKPDLEIHGHKHPSSMKMYVWKREWWPPNSGNLAYEGENCWNAAMNCLILDTETLGVEVK